MENSIIDRVKNIFQEDTITALANSTETSAANVKSSLNAMTPLILLALEEKSERDLSRTLESATHVFGNSYLPETETLAIETSGQKAVSKPNLIADIFNNNRHTVIQALSKYLTISPETTEALLSASLPAVLSVLTTAGQHGEVKHVFDVLKSHKANFLETVPPALTTLTIDTKLDASMHAAIPPATPADAIIDPTYTSTVQATEAPVVHTSESVSKKQQSSKIWWLLGLIILVGLWVLFGKGCNGELANASNEPQTEQR